MEMSVKVFSLRFLGSTGGSFSKSTGWTLVTTETFEKLNYGIEDGHQFTNMAITFFIL